MHMKHGKDAYYFQFIGIFGLLSYYNACTTLLLTCICVNVCVLSGGDGPYKMLFSGSTEKPINKF